MPKNPNKERCQTLILFTRFLNLLLPYVAESASGYDDLITSDKLRAGQAKSADINPADPLQNLSYTWSHSLLPTLFSLLSRAIAKPARHGS